jgi:hypothetical protein
MIINSNLEPATQMQRQVRTGCGSPLSVGQVPVTSSVPAARSDEELYSSTVQQLTKPDGVSRGPFHIILLGPALTCNILRKIVYYAKKLYLRGARIRRAFPRRALGASTVSWLSLGPCLLPLATVAWSVATGGAARARASQRSSNFELIIAIEPPPRAAAAARERAHSVSGFGAYWFFRRTCFFLQGRGASRVIWSRGLL